MTTERLSIIAEEMEKNLKRISDYQGQITYTKVAQENFPSGEFIGMQHEAFNEIITTDGKVYIEGKGLKCKIDRETVQDYPKKIHDRDLNATGLIKVTDKSLYYLDGKTMKTVYKKSSKFCRNILSIDPFHLPSFFPLKYGFNAFLKNSEQPVCLYPELSFYITEFLAGRRLERFTVYLHDDEVINSIQCYVVEMVINKEINGHLIRFRFWVSPSQNYMVIKKQRWNGGETIEDNDGYNPFLCEEIVVEPKYYATDDIWFPQSAKLTEYGVLNGVLGSFMQEDGTYKFGKTSEETYNFSNFVFNQNIPDSAFEPDLSGIEELEIIDNINQTRETKHL